MKEEFDQLFRLEKQAEDERAKLRAAALTGSDAQLDQHLEAVDIEGDQRVRELLGPQRYADYRRSQDPDYQTLYSLALDQNVPTDVASQVWNMRREVERQTTGVRANPLLSPEQQERALEAIRFGTPASIVDVLGEPLVRDYERQGGAWLSELTAPLPRSETVPPTPPLAPLPLGQSTSPPPVLAVPRP